MNLPSAWFYPCPKCGAASEQDCVTPAGKEAATFHAARSTRFVHERAGPQINDVVYIDGLKHRVVSDCGADGTFIIRHRGPGRYALARDAVAFDPIAGMWRELIS
ncbi:MAG TPA: hypothetical protein VIP09_16010 [Dehalococcoidia bacterium]|jgi:hypothetical protein